MRNHYKYLVLSIPLLLLLFFSCNRTVSESEPIHGTLTGDSIYITDRTGKKWNITRAVNNYGMKAENFHYGLGPFAIKPIIDPLMLSPGDSGYPDEHYDRAILGYVRGEEARAYAISDLSGHEVANDVIQGVPIAAVY